MTPEEKRKQEAARIMAMRFNRRHPKREEIAAFLRANPTKSSRETAEKFGVDPKTVRRIRGAKPDLIIGKDGSERKLSVRPISILTTAKELLKMVKTVVPNRFNKEQAQELIASRSVLIKEIDTLSSKIAQIRRQEESDAKARREWRNETKIPRNATWND